MKQYLDYQKCNDMSASKVMILLLLLINTVSHPQPEELIMDAVMTINWTAASDDVNLTLGQTAKVTASKAQANGDHVYNKISDSSDEHFRIQLNRRGRADRRDKEF